MFKSRFFVNLGNERFRAWEDLRFPASGINPPGAASDPTRSTTDGTFIFSASATNILAGVAQLPHKWKEGSTLYSHIHLESTNANTGNMLWRFSYDISNINGSFSGTYTDVDVLIANDGTIGKHFLVPLGSIAMTGYKISSIIKWKLARIGDDVTDTYTSTSKLLEFDIHYEIDSLGSPAEYVK